MQCKCCVKEKVTAFESSFLIFFASVKAHGKHFEHIL